MVKVGNSECEFLKLTPLSRTSAIAGAVCGVTMRPRRPSGTNRIRLRGVAFCADAEPAARAISPADSNMVEWRIMILPPRGTGCGRCRRSRLVLLCDGIVTLCGTGLKGGEPVKCSGGRSIVALEETSSRRDRSPRKEDSHEQLSTEGRGADQ